MIARRHALGLAALAAMPVARAVAQTPEVIPLWQDRPQGDEDVGSHGQIRDVTASRLIVHRPAKPNGMAVIVMAGGGYRVIEQGRESGPASAWLQSLGVTAYELIYRLPGPGMPASDTFADGLRAVQIVRSNTPGGRVGLLGFSSGAHLAGMTAATVPVDFAGLIYPVLTMMPPWNHTQAFKVILGDHGDEAQYKAFSVDRQVRPGWPPVFLAQAADDPVSPIENSLLMFAALRRADILPEMHIFRAGGHGWGLGAPGSEVAAWPALFARWAGMD